MFDKALSTVQKYHMLSPNDSVVIGFSGGADSCALLHFFVSLREKFNLTVSACHINHQLRGAEADRDENFVAEMCRKYSVPLYTLHADVKGESLKRKISTEQCGRDIILKPAFFCDCTVQMQDVFIRIFCPVPEVFTHLCPPFRHTPHRPYPAAS